MIICTYTGRLKFLAAEPAIRTLQSGRTGSLRVASAKGLFNARVSTVLWSPALKHVKLGWRTNFPSSASAGLDLSLLLARCGPPYTPSVAGFITKMGGTHDHPRPTVRLHLAKEERDEFAAIVREQPKTGPLKLVVGRPTASGPAQSVAKISPLLVNADRVKYERQKVLRGSGGHGGDHFLSEFAKIEASNPNFIRSSQFGLVSAIVMQTPFLASRLIKAVSVDTEAVNGIVSDAAHGFWADRNSILIISSTYEPVYLQCWVPGLISYSNGGTAEHYRIHFFQLFLSMAEESRQRAIELIDDMLANVSSWNHFHGCTR
ncbi:hypothetical protein B0H14DRAFT_2543346 [Mycena olivaceomarginata]|nr:hypothetical protein B0H14DRAFT_2543346 [Mycena olivaceomarginata]